MFKFRYSRLQLVCWIVASVVMTLNTLTSWAHDAQKVISNDSIVKSAESNQPPQLSKVVPEQNSESTVANTTPREDSGWLISLLSGLAGAIVGASAASYLGRKQKVKELTFDFHRELNQESMMKHRVATAHVLASNTGKNLDELFKKIPNELHSVWVVTGFYDRLLAAINHKMVSEKLLSPLFGELFCYFYYGFFESQLLPVDWDLSRNMKTLEENLKGRTNTETWSQWEKAGRKEAKSVVESMSPFDQEL